MSLQGRLKMLFFGWMCRHFLIKLDHSGGKKNECWAKKPADCAQLLHFKHWIALMFLCAAGAQIFIHSFKNYSIFFCIIQPKGGSIYPPQCPPQWSAMQLLTAGVPAGWYWKHSYCPLNPGETSFSIFVISNHESTDCLWNGLKFCPTSLASFCSLTSLFYGIGGVWGSGWPQQRCSKLSEWLFLLSCGLSLSWKQSCCWTDG